MEFSIKRMNGAFEYFYDSHPGFTKPTDAERLVKGCMSLLQTPNFKWLTEDEIIHVLVKMCRGEYDTTKEKIGELAPYTFNRCLILYVENERKSQNAKQYLDDQKSEFYYQPTKRDRQMGKIATWFINWRMDQRFYENYEHSQFEKDKDFLSGLEEWQLTKIHEWMITPKANGGTTYEKNKLFEYLDPLLA